MFCISTLISASEWNQFQQEAREAWPRETLSRSEVIRRFALAGVKALKQASPAEQARMTHEFQSSMTVEDTHLRTSR